MGKLIYSMSCSLDGYVADSEGNFDWSAPNEEVLEAINAQEREIGTYLFGRRMYEVMAVWDTDWQSVVDTPQSAAYAEAWATIDKVVHSTTLTEVTTPRARLERELDPAAVRRLIDGADRDVAIAGPTLASQALRHGLVDEVRIIVCPVLVGGGLPLFTGGQVDLRLTGDHRFGDGTVQLNYAVRPSS